MRAADLDIHELLHFFPEGGLITFAGERVLLLDAVAIGDGDRGDVDGGRIAEAALATNVEILWAAKARPWKAASGYPVSFAGLGTCRRARWKMPSCQGWIGSRLSLRLPAIRILSMS